MENIRLINKIKEVNPKAYEEFRENLIVKRIRQRYSPNAELAILRQKDSKPEEFAAYNAYVEECKTAVKEELGI